MNSLYNFFVAIFLIFSASIGAAANEYMVIDVSAGPAAVTYPFTYYDTNSLPFDVTNEIYKTGNILLKKISHGSFVMGSPSNEVGRVDNREDLVTVSLNQDFYIGVFEITEMQWSKVVADSSGTARKPKGNVTLPYIQNSFLSDLNAALDLGGMQVDLPAEAQWEYACRAGTTNAYSFGDDESDLNDYGWYLDNGGNNTYEVGLKLPNPWGLYDMHGNAAEFCYGLTNHPHSSAYVCRSGGTGISRPAEYCRSAFRPAVGDSLDGKYVGFRIAVSIPPPPTTYYLTVINGSGDNSYTNAHIQEIVANPAPAWHKFDRWIGDTNTVADVNAPTTTVTIAGADLSIEATYKALTYNIAVSNGTSSVSIATNGQVVAIYADPPAATNAFYGWAGDIASVQDISAPTTTATVAGADINLTALYRNVYWLSVTNGAAVVTGQHYEGAVVPIQATAPDAIHDFLWVGDIATVAVSNSWNTTLVMPSRNVGLKATYPDKRFLLVVESGSGGGSYTNGTQVNVALTNTPSELHLFEKWAGDVAGLASTTASSTVFTINGSAASIAPRFLPVAATRGEYLVVDLPYGGSAYELTYLDAPPVGGWVSTYKSDKMVFKRIMPGSFPMGADDDGAVTGENKHTVTLTKPFYIGIYEVTQGQWKNVMGTYPSNYSGSGRDLHPVESISYDVIRGASQGSEWPATTDVDSTSFVGKMRVKGSSDGFDLPTEAQWEYACRAGTTGSWYSSDLLNIAYYSVNGSNHTWEVGLKTPNSWGLYDMHGNVYEKGLDWFNGVGLGTASDTDPVGPASSDGTGKRVVRGGSYNFGSSEYMKSGYRAGQHKTNEVAHVGFRMLKSDVGTNQLAIVDSKINSGGMIYYRAQIAISAVDKVGKEFDYWSVEPATVYPGSRFDRQSRDTVITMPNHSLTVRAYYK